MDFFLGPTPWVIVAYAVLAYISFKVWTVTGRTIQWAFVMFATAILPGLWAIYWSSSLMLFSTLPIVETDIIASLLIIVLIQVLAMYILYETLNSVLNHHVRH